ncbi:type II toxin-antitoxin system death-on-curing family toxin [Sulfitobacter pontiacus]|jgi:death-on-curing protein|uniref:type II toxin-antitoxin system death-on-curing family toxin n=1 Tax=Sulfitobacter pontiacus TaxID=60137 RepID=UPI0007DA4915|nr:type II toxin-antitoxin system death-on-curing family toxin [Sulfitobacter pontiacus]OAN83569.1 death-on-curing protein [Sulfitobacter pontiacus]PTB91963.1 type II toxin-antitoxin system death-on-curing family toxin [Marinobacter sp. B9-2]BDY17308.1 death-on-curing protein [Sulfitobacter pontiacus]HBR38557.1 type II toxin-antitoxin system death-on-curing family toxin [Sulfitobacter pontiacus]|tara:strand:- start:1113 stop:1511 length:399 start_codon:yes stop_codon:yes gene_type:complete
MTEPRWVTRELVEYMHDCVLELAGGARGLRDGDLLESALARPMNLYAFGETSLFELAACYAEAIARNHAFVDGNKRTAFFVASDFLDQNGYELQAAVDQEHADMMVELAQGKMTRADAAAHLRSYSIKTSAT